MNTLAIFVVLGLSVAKISGASVSTTETILEDSKDSTNGTEPEEGPQDLYVIKTIVYEVGILTDAGNSSDDNSTHEQVNLTFFDPSTNNGSLIDLSSIPAPLQTNVSGISLLTGLVPNLTDVIPDKQVKVTQNISTSDPQKGAQIISNLPKLLGLDNNGTYKLSTN